MVSEAELVLKVDEPMDFIVSNLVGIEKGTICELTTPRTAIAASSDGGVFAGIARREKIANDGRTRLALFRRGIFRLTAGSDAITAGEWVSISLLNLIRTAAAADIEDGKAIGIALEDISATETGEVFVGGH